MFSLEGKKALVVGVANDQSIAYGIARALRTQGADLAITYLNARAEPHVRPLAEDLGAELILPLDVAEDAQMDAVFAAIAERWGSLDFLVHAIVFSDKTELRGSYTDNTTAANFSQTMLISVYSFTAVCQRAAALMTDGGSCLTLSYYGAEKVMPRWRHSSTSYFGFSSS